MGAFILNLGISSSFSSAISKPLKYVSDTFKNGLTYLYYEFIIFD